MNSTEIRKGFLDFFRSRGHIIVQSASLVPDNDPTLLFTNAGMNQFKDIFLDTGKREYTRAADTQKCMRVSGKHNDLEDVGKDSYHHTFFEMLGNWSFGDYYKKEIISWAWELLTEVWKLPKSKLYATVHNTDDEAFEFWGTRTDIAKDHILKFGDKENFWEMGAAGPCGPCSEIHIDRGEQACDKKDVKGHKCAVNAGCARYIELWNLVFIQYNRGEGGKLYPLPKKHVDTGMGFERIVSVIQNKLSNYDTDLFGPIIAKIEELCGCKYEAQTGMPVRVIADHIRALTFAMADGVMPSNEGRGYVVRKILRRAIRYGRKLSFTEPFLNRIVDTVISVMGNSFPEIVERAEMIKSLIFSEEESFLKTVNRGLDRLNDIVEITKKKNKKVIGGEDLFMLYDSLGLPVDFIQQVAEDEKLSIDMDGFKELMEKQKERARASWKGEAFDFSVISGAAVETKYTGEESSEDKGVIQIIVMGGKMVKTASDGDDIVFVSDKSPFYPEKGGQVGDTGIAISGETGIEIRNTKVYENTILHYAHINKGKLKQGDEISLIPDMEKKQATARNHTATHIIHKALRNTVGEHAAQAGSLVGPERLRFDFTHSRALTREEIENIENEANRIVLQNLPVNITKMNKQEAVKSGAVAIFEEKYGEVVRVVEVKGYSKELCGGTHVGRSGDIGLIKIVSETSISAGTRRLEAVTGLNSLESYREYYYRVKEIAGILNTDEIKLLDRVNAQSDALRDKDREIEALKKAAAKADVENLIGNAVMIGGAKVIIAKTDMDPETMINVSDEFKSKDLGIMYLISAVSSNKVVITVSSSKAYSVKIKAGDLARETAKIVGGNGGGRPDFAQAGGKDPSKMEEALKMAREMIEKALK
ncbi:MAG: alanine--tRNA ligase [Brevinematales bacterium]